MKLGKRVQIALGVPDLAATSAFFVQLGMQPVDGSSEPYPWAQFSDGQNLILLNQDGMVYRGLIYFNPDLDEQVARLEADGVAFFWKQPAPDGGLQSAMFIDPTGPDGPNGAANVGVNIVAHDPVGLHTPAGVPLTRCGKFGELALAVDDYAQTTAFWARLGFEPLLENREPYPWGIWSDGMLVLGVHQNKTFSLPGTDGLNLSPALTYFSADSPTRIAALKADGLVPAFEIAGADGTISHAGFQSPDGTTFFIFEGEI